MRKLLTLVALIFIVGTSNIYAQQSTDNTTTSNIEQDLNNLFDNGRYDKALGVCRQLIKEQPNNDKYYYYLSSIYLKLDSLDQALATCKRRLQLTDPKYYFAWHQIEARIYTAQRDKKATLKALKQEEENIRKYDVKNLHIAYRDYVNQLIALNDYKLANTYANKALKLGLDTAQFYIQKGHIYGSQKMFAEANKWYQLASNYTAEALPFLSYCYAELGETKQAIKAIIDYHIATQDSDYDQLLLPLSHKDEAYTLAQIEEHMKNSNNLYFATHMHFSVCVELRYLDDAMKDANIIKEQWPNIDTSYLMISQVQKLLGNHQEAINTLKQAIAIMPTGQLYYQRAICYVAIADYNKALKDCNILINNYPQSTYYTYQLMIDLHWKTQNYTEVINDCDSINAIDYHPIYSIYKGLALEKLNRPKEANICYQQVVDSCNKHNHNNTFYYAFALYQQGKTAEANKIIETTEQESNYNIARYYALTGDTKKSIEYLHKLLKDNSFPYRIHFDFTLDNVRQLPEFTEILNQLHQNNNSKRQ